ncbi:hypothetical protein CKAH01_05048 [Colletotrichum kahawae]|uniref:Uncharacterized protein n=1 Tax=Colletotrichum kahawae TaxID=34407 RepID=A0AAD9YFP0_COLKA|nr:hypothetical protein CKAH01_05048 [Colletotrichum kahawae]
MVQARCLFLTIPVAVAPRVNRGSRYAVRYGGTYRSTLFSFWATVHADVGRTEVASLASLASYPAQPVRAVAGDREGRLQVPKANPPSH